MENTTQRAKRIAELTKRSVALRDASIQQQAKHHELATKAKRLGELIALRKKLRDMVKAITKASKLAHDIEHNSRAVSVANHKVETINAAVGEAARSEKPIDLAKIERTMNQAMEVSNRIGKDQEALDLLLDELIASFED